MGPYQRPGGVCSEYQGSGARRGTRPLLLLLLLLFLPIVLATGYWLLATGSYWLVLYRLWGVVARHCAACCISPTCFGFRRWAVPFCFSLFAFAFAFGSWLAATRAAGSSSSSQLAASSSYSPFPYLTRSRIAQIGGGRGQARNAKLTGVIRLGEPAPALPQSCSALYWWCSAHWIPNCQLGNPLTSTPPAP
jgi:hypothetical protein